MGKTVIDYTAYNERYQYMEQVLRNLRVQNQMMQMYGKSHVGGTSYLNFAEALINAERRSSKVSESMEHIFQEASKKYDVPVTLLKAMAKVESNFDDKAVSSAGAQGVMQLMPATAKSLGVKDSFDARENIMGGAKYIAQMLKQYNGNVELALAAYNAGSGNVSKYGGVPPFRETQNYIRKVKEYMASDIHINKQILTTFRG